MTHYQPLWRQQDRDAARVRGDVGALHAAPDAAQLARNARFVADVLGADADRATAAREAREVLAKYLELSRGKRDTIENLRAYKQLPDSKFERLYGGLRQAGMSEK